MGSSDANSKPRATVVAGKKISGSSKAESAELGYQHTLVIFKITQIPRLNDT